MVSFIYIQRDHFLNYTWDQIHAVVAYYYNYDDYVNYISITGKEKVVLLCFIHLACDNGTFGQNCSEKCGRCAYFGQCHHVNGICLEGCVSGFIGSTCKARAYIVDFISISIKLVVFTFT